MARQGKIARLSAALRREVNLRLMDGQSASAILPWLNSEPDAIRVWEEWFEGAPCSPKNLSEWRLGGYKEWRKSRERLEDLKELTEWSLEVVKATNSGIADAAARIAAGHLVDTLEMVGNIAVTGGSTDAEKDPNDGLAEISGAIAKLQKGDRDKEASKRKDAMLALQQERHELRKKEVALAYEKFELLTVQKFMLFAREPEVQAILSSRETKSVQMDKLHQLLFGSNPNEQKDGSGTSD